MAPHRRVVLWTTLLGIAVCTDAATTLARPPANRQFSTLLTLDGGGLKQYMTTQILKKLESLLIEHYWRNKEDLFDVPPYVKDEIRLYLCDFFDLIAGVSAGSWVGLYLSSRGGNGAANQVFSKPDIVKEYGTIYPGSARGLDVFFERYGSQIYPFPTCGRWSRLPRCRELPRSCKGYVWPRILSLPVPGIRGLTSPLFCAEGLTATLEKFYGTTRLSELNTGTIVHTVDLRVSEPVAFGYARLPSSNGTMCDVPMIMLVQSRASSPRGGVTGDPFGSLASVGRLTMASTYSADQAVFLGQDVYIADIARASSAFPGVQEAKVVKPVTCAMPHTLHESCRQWFPCNEDTPESALLVDGALVSNNPIMLATNFLSEISGVTDVAEIATLSLGTGSTASDRAFLQSAGNLQWSITGSMMSILADGGTEFVQSTMNFFFTYLARLNPDQYLRIQAFADTNTPEGYALTAFFDSRPENLRVLRRLGDQYAELYHDKLDIFARTYLAPVPRKTDDGGGALRFSAAR